MSLHKVQLIIEASTVVMGALYPIANPIGSAASTRSVGWRTPSRMPDM